jgi:hypothetical protein
VQAQFFARIHGRGSGGSAITIVDPKAHGLGYLYPPANSPKGWEDEHDAPKWIYEFWESMLRLALKLQRTDPKWIKRPQMMRMSVTTFNVLKRLHTWHGFRPYNFFLLPILAKGGYPADIDLQRFSLVAPFESNQARWMSLTCINIADPNDHFTYKLSMSFTSPEYSKRAIVEVFEDLLYGYRQHPEAKSLGPDGQPCNGETRGLLQRAHIVAVRHRRIGKESDRRWEEGDELDSLSYVPIQFEPPGSEHQRTQLARATESLIRKIRKIGIRVLVRTGLSRRMLEKIQRRELVPILTLREYEKMVKAYRTPGLPTEADTSKSAK